MCSAVLTRPEGGGRYDCPIKIFIVSDSGYRHRKQLSTFPAYIHEQDQSVVGCGRQCTNSRVMCRAPVVGNDRRMRNVNDCKDSEVSLINTHLFADKQQKTVAPKGQVAQRSRRARIFNAGSS